MPVVFTGEADTDAPSSAPLVTSSSASQLVLSQYVPDVVRSPEDPHQRTAFLAVYHQYVTSTVHRFFAGSGLAFWRDTVAQMAWSDDLVCHAILCLGALHRAALLPAGHAQKGYMRVQGVGAYTSALGLARGSIGIRQVGVSSVAVMIVFALGEVVYPTLPSPSTKCLSDYVNKDRDS